MRRMKLILPLVVMVALVASFAYAEDIEIDDAYTMNYIQEPETDFDVWSPVMYHVDYSFTGYPSKTYNVKIIIKSMGDTIKITEKHKPGSYTTVTANLACSDDAGTHTVKYTVKLKKGGLLDVDTDTSQITVSGSPDNCFRIPITD